MRVEDKDLDALLPHAAMDGGASRVARSGSENGECFAALFHLPLVEESEQLKSEVLERERWAVPQFQHEGLVVELAQRCHVRAIESGISLSGERTPFFGADLGSENLEKLRGKFGIREC